MNSMMNSKITTKTVSFNEELKCDLLILAAGFEDRALHFLSNAKFKKGTFCILFRFVNDPGLNEPVFKKYRTKMNSKFEADKRIVIDIKPNSVLFYEKELNRHVAELPRYINDVFIDISGMPTFAICITLNSIRSHFSTKPVNVIYTAAKSYFPTVEEYNSLKAKGAVNDEFVPKSMAMEMSEVLILETFSGHRSKEGISCLAVFAGYDAHRSGGVIESINPSMLLLLYGDPGNSDLKWRLDLSKQLHRKFETTRKTAIETVSTRDLNESLAILEEYYEYLFEDYDFTVAPICSKMQVVGTYLFWERYKEVQLVFPLPIGYVMDRRPKDVSDSYLTVLPPRNSLYRNLDLSNISDEIN
jgi:hypothetical protein